MDEFVSMAPFALILCAGIFVQSAAGFAAGLLIVPAMLWFGYSIPEAQTALLVATIPQNVWGIWTFRDAISFRTVTAPGITRVVFLPLGVAVLQALETFPVVRLRQIVGGVVLMATLVILFFRPRPRERLHPIWAALAFPVSGFLQGVVGMGGPAMVFWVQAHDWDTRRVRGFLFTMYLISIGPALLILYGFFGDRIIRPGIAALALIPVLLVVTYAGLRCGTWLGRARLRNVTFGLLLMIGLAGLFAPWLSGS